MKTGLARIRTTPKNGRPSSMDSSIDHPQKYQSHISGLITHGAETDIRSGYIVFVIIVVVLTLPL